MLLNYKMKKLSKKNKNFLYIKKISKNEISKIQKAFIRFIGEGKKKITIQNALEKSKNLSYKSPGGVILPKKGMEQPYLDLQNLFYKIIFKQKKICEYFKKNSLLIHFPINIRVASDDGKRNYDSRIPHYDKWVGEPEGLCIISLNVYRERDGALLQILDGSKVSTSANKKLKKYLNQKRANKKLRVIYTQKVGDLVFMKDCYHRTFGGFGKRLNLEARFIDYRENINFKKNNNINTKDRSFGYFPLNTIQNINYKNLRFLNKKSGQRSKRDYPVDFSFDFNI